MFKWELPCFNVSPLPHVLSLPPLRSSGPSPSAPIRYKTPGPSPPQAGHGWFHPGGVTATCWPPVPSSCSRFLSPPARMHSGSIYVPDARTPPPALLCSSVVPLASCTPCLCMHPMLSLELPVTPCPPCPAPIPTSLPTRGTLLTAVGSRVFCAQSPSSTQREQAEGEQDASCLRV